MSLSMETVVALDFFQQQDIEPTPQSVKLFLQNFSEYPDSQKAAFATIAATNQGIPEEEMSWKSQSNSKAWSGKQMRRMRTEACDTICREQIKAFHEHPHAMIRALSGTFLIDTVMSTHLNVSAKTLSLIGDAIQYHAEHESDFNVRMMVAAHWDLLNEECANTTGSNDIGKFSPSRN